jgi:hypothetical protein
MGSDYAWLAAAGEVLTSSIFWIVAVQWAAFAPLYELAIGHSAIRRLAFPWWAVAFLVMLLVLGLLVFVLPLVALGMLPLQAREHRTELFWAFVLGGSVSALLRRLVQRRRHAGHLH